MEKMVFLVQVRLKNPLSYKSQLEKTAAPLVLLSFAADSARMCHLLACFVSYLNHITTEIIHGFRGNITCV